MAQTFFWLLHTEQETLKAKSEAYNELRAGAYVKQPCAC